MMELKCVYINYFLDLIIKFFPCKNNPTLVHSINYLSSPHSFHIKKFQFKIIIIGIIILKTRNNNFMWKYYINIIIQMFNNFNVNCRAKKKIITKR